MRHVASVAILLVSSSVFAGWTRKGDASVTFAATGTLGLKIEGTATELDVKDDGATLKLTVQLKNVETGIGLRNKHMLEDIEAAKFPEVTLSIPLDTLKLPEEGKSLEGQGKGTWNFHGKTKELPFTYTASLKGGLLTVEATSPLNVKEFDVKIRSYMGITVKPEVTIRAKLSLQK